MTPLLTVDDAGYPVVREIRGLAFPITVLTSAVHLDAEQKGDREVHSRRLVTVWNAHDQLVDVVQMIRDADNDAASDGLPRIPASARAAIDAALIAAGAA